MNGYPNSALPIEIAEVISDNSFCIMTNLVPKGKHQMYKSIFHPMCYQIYCSSKSLTIGIYNKYVVCPREGGNIEVEGYDGYLNCPDYNLICTGTVLCNDIFDCIDKKSLPNEESFIYHYTPSYSIQNLDLFNSPVLSGHELSNDGKCPLSSTYCTKNNYEEKDNIIGTKTDENVDSDKIKGFYIRKNIICLISLFLL